MIKRKNKYLINALLVIALVLFGIIIGKLCNFTYFKVDQNINLIDIISIIGTFAAAYFIAKILDKEKQDTRTEKDLIIKRTEDIYQLIDDSNDKIVTGKIKYQEAAFHVKRINVSINCIYRIIGNTDITTDENLKTELLNNIRNLRNLLTDSPKINEMEIQNSNLSNEVKDSIIHLTQGRISEIEIEYDKLRGNILIFQLTINKA